MWASPMPCFHWPNFCLPSCEFHNSLLRGNSNPGPRRKSSDLQQELAGQGSARIRFPYLSVTPTVAASSMRLRSEPRVFVVSPYLC